MWGAWWVWDARLTSVLVLFLLYLGYMALWQAIEEPIRAGRVAAILALVGFVNVPIIKFSVDWWYTLHQPASIVRMDGPSIHPSMLWPLGLMMAGFTTYYLWVMLLRVRGEIVANKIRVLRLRQVHG
jgi:heme exporter protein C